MSPVIFFIRISALLQSTYLASKIYIYSIGNIYIIILPKGCVDENQKHSSTVSFSFGYKV